MPVRTSIINTVASTEVVDMSIAMMAFPSEFVHDAQKVEFDFFEATDTIALKGSFAKQANVVDKDGYKTITVNPMQINEKITDSVKNVGRKRVGHTIYGDAKGISAAAAQAIEDEAEGFLKLKRRGMRLLKKSLYDVLTTGKVTVSGEGEATDEVDYGLDNIIINDNATAGQYQWNDTTNSNPIEQLESEAVALKQHAVDTYVLGDEARKAFMAHPDVRTSDNTSEGKMKNFILPTPEERDRMSTDTFLYLGRTTGEHGKPLYIYSDIDTYNDGSSDVFYLDKNYAVGFKKENMENGQIHYGAIPELEGDGESAKIILLQTKEHIDGKIMKDPVGIQRFYKTSPLPTMNQPKAFISIKATLIA